MTDDDTTGARAPKALPSTQGRVREILAEVRRLAVEYYLLTGKPLGVTGEVADYFAAELFGLYLVPPRTAGHDAIRELEDGTRQRVQIKGRAYDPRSRASQRIGTIKTESECDIVMLVLLANTSLEPVEIWEAPFRAVLTRLLEPGSKARNERGALSVADFRRIGIKTWPPAERLS